MIYYIPMYMPQRRVKPRRVYRIRRRFIARKPNRVIIRLRPSNYSHQRYIRYVPRYSFIPRNNYYPRYRYYTILPKRTRKKKRLPRFKRAKQRFPVNNQYVNQYNNSEDYIDSYDDSNNYQELTDTTNNDVNYEVPNEPNVPNVPDVHTDVTVFVPES